MSLQPGQLLLNRYEFRSALGAGAMGEVLEVRDRYSGIDYALKRIPPDKVLNPGQMEAVRSNFALISRLSHPHIVTTRQLEIDPQTGHVLILMDLVRGFTLADWLAQQRQLRGSPMAPLPLDLALSVAGQIADALDYAHDLPVSFDTAGKPKGILHRDLKPANVMVELRPNSSEPPVVRLVDFGLAAEIQTTLMGMSIDPNARDARNRVAGTLLYMAPEQYTAGTLTRGVDQWALAVLVYEMLAGRRPFEGQSVEEITERVLKANPAPIQGLAPVAWQALRTAFSYDRKQRHATCRQFVEAMRGAPQTWPATLPQGGHAFPPPIPQGTPLPGPVPARSGGSLSFAVALVVTLVLLLLFAGGGLALFFALRTDPFTEAVEKAERSEAAGDWDAVFQTLDRAMNEPNSSAHRERRRAEQLLARAAFALGERYGKDKDYTTALPYYRRAAEAGLADAQYALANMYHHGQGTAVNGEEAERWFAAAAEQHHAAAANDAGTYCEKRKDYARALDFYRRSAEGGNMVGQFNCGRLYFEGLGTPVDHAQAFPWLLKSADQGYGSAESYAGWMLWQGKGTSSDPQRGFQYLKRSADKDILNAMHNLAVMYENGHGTSADRNQAIFWYTKAAKAGRKESQDALDRLNRAGTPADPAAAERAYQNGMAAAQRQDWSSALREFQSGSQAGHVGCTFQLANLYFNGYGLQRDLGKAYQLALAAAERGNADAQNLIGYMHGTGTGALQDYRQAFQWYSKGAANGSHTAKGNLGYLYLNGFGVDKDLKKALELYEQSARAGNANSSYTLGDIYFRGDLVAQDHNRAFNWFTAGARLGHPAAMAALGNMYANGLGTAISYTAAVDWFRQAADKGDVMGMNYLGQHYEKGWGVERNTQKALEWYKKAADLGYKPAQENLARLGKLPMGGGKP